MTRTIHIRGIKIRTATQRRYVVVRIDVDRVTRETKRADIHRRSDSADTARTIARRYGTWHSETTATYCVVVDTTTGEEI